MQNATRPDMDRMISGGQARKRRAPGREPAAPPSRWCSSVAARTPSRSATAGTPKARGSQTPQPRRRREGRRRTRRPSPRNQGGLEPGTYRLLVGFDSKGAQIDADLTVGTRDWRDGNFPIVRVGAFVGGVGVYQPHGLAAGSGCSGDRLNTDLGRGERSCNGSPGSLEARSSSPLSGCGPSATTRPIGVRIDDDCPAGQAYRVAETREAVAESATATCPRRSSPTSGSSTSDDVGRGRRVAPARFVGGPGEPGRPGPPLGHVRCQDGWRGGGDVKGVVP